MLKIKKLQACWDLSLEKLSLGGLLVFRKEMEFLAQISNLNQIHVFFFSANKNNFHEDLIIQVLQSSAIDFYIEKIQTKRSINMYPFSEDKMDPHFSYQNFDRIKYFSKNLSQFPMLSWNLEIQKTALNWSKKIRRKKIFALHLKQEKSKNLFTSNANLPEWSSFIKRQIQEKDYDFCLLGSDIRKSDLFNSPQIHDLHALDIPLAVQLCLVSYCDGFLGMASGPCQAAIFSKIPYVIFKHPDHHSEEMERELGINQRLPFGMPNQFFWRIPHNQKTLLKAMEHING